MKILNSEIQQKLRDIVWDNVKDITMKGGMEFYNKLMLDIDRGEIDSEDELAKRMYKK